MNLKIAIPKIQQKIRIVQVLGEGLTAKTDLTINGDFLKNT